MNVSSMLFFAVVICVHTTANAQQYEPRHSHYDAPEVINGRAEPDRLPPGMRLQYVLKARLNDLKEEMSDEDFAVISAGVEKIRLADERRKERELEEFDYMCRNLPLLDIESIIQIIDNSHLEVMNFQESAVRKHLSGLSGSGEKILSHMMATTEYHIQIVHPNNAEYARNHPDFFRSALSDKCAAYLAYINESGPATSQ